MRYLNRLCHLFNGGLHVAPVALLYHGEAEWSGKTMFLQKPARELFEGQIDFDILPQDVFADMRKYNAHFDGSLHVNGETYKALVLPYSQFITTALAEYAAKASASGFAVVFIDALPEGICDGASVEKNFRLLEGLKSCSVVRLKELATHLRRKGIHEIKLSEPFKRLRYYHYQHENDIFMFFNEDLSQTFDGSIDVPPTGNAVSYDALENVIRPVQFELVDGGTRLHLRLEPYQSIIVVFGEFKGESKPVLINTGKRILLEGAWNFSMATAEEYPNFHDARVLTKLENIGSLYPDFSGFMRYEKEFDFRGHKHLCLEIENAYDGVEVWVNGNYAGMSICPPYRFDLSGLVQVGKNTLRIEVANTLDRQVRAKFGEDPVTKFFMGFTALSPAGIVGKVALYAQ